MRASVLLGLFFALISTLPLSFSQSYIASLGQQFILPAPRPVVSLWSWQHDDDFSSIDTSRVIVTRLVGRFFVQGDKFVFQRNLCRMIVPPGTRLQAAVRVDLRELGCVDCGLLSDKLSRSIVEQVVCGTKKVEALQIDFDAKKSERQFYKTLLIKIRKRLPASIKLSITSLASWCMGDNWLQTANLPVDEIVPMLFSLGPNRTSIKNLVADKKVLPSNLFTAALSPAFSINEADIFAAMAGKRDSYKRIYLFCSNGWHHQTLKKAEEMSGLTNIEVHK